MPGSSNAVRKPRRKWPWWLLGLIAAFLLGLWLGRGPAAKKNPLCGTPGTVESGPGKLIKGPGEPIKLGDPGTGDVPGLSGGGGSSKSPHRSGVDSDGRVDDSDDPSHGNSPKGNPGGDDQASPSNSAAGALARNDLRKYAERQGGPEGDGRTTQANGVPQGKSYSANDFTYDKTNLPRYADSVSAVVSSISYGPDGRTDTYSTGAGIVTSSSFDSVVAWYRAHLPAGWHDMTIGDMGQLSMQLSAQSIAKMLGAQPGDSPDTSAAGAAAPAAADKVRISLFTPPAGSPKSSIMIVQHGDGPVEALLHAKVAPAS
jgi:hypothetical protein